MIDLKTANEQLETFEEAHGWHIGYHKGMLVMADIFAEAIHKQGATIDTLKELLQIIRLSSTPPTEEQ